MPVDQMLRGVTSEMGVLIYLGSYFQALRYSSSGKLPIIGMVQTRIWVPPPTR